MSFSTSFRPTLLCGKASTPRAQGSRRRADGDEEIYNIFDTKAILNRPPRISISSTSGLAGIAFWINDYYQLPPEHRVEKNDPLVAEMKKIIDEQYAHGRNTIMGDDELDNLVRMIDKKRYKEFLIYGQ